MNKVMGMVQGGAQHARKQVEATASYINAVLFKDDRGDTNFVSILILLAIALALASVFMIFRNRIVDFVQNQMAAFSDDFSTQRIPSGASIASSKLKS